MQKKSSTPAKKKTISKIKPEMKWQTGAYAKIHDYRFRLPYQFLLICKIMDITPENILIDFMDNLACSSWKRDGRDKAKSTLIDYIIDHGYGQRHYTAEDIRTMFKELDAVGMCWPDKGKMSMIDLYAKWRDKHLNYWFKKWFRKPRKKLN